MQHSTSYRLVVLATIAALGIFLSGLAKAQAYPSRSVRIIVPVGAGSGFDVTARLIG